MTSFIALLVLTPLLLPVLIVLRVTGEGAVFFRQERLGLDGKPFRIWKLVTMRRDSPLSGTITARDDPRILPMGRVLRNTKLNELPQLINILVGEMSWVGPRPLTTEAYSFYPDKLKPLVWKSKPGLTGIGSIAFRNEEELLATSGKDRHACYREDIMPLKGALEVWYLTHKSLRNDLLILLQTAIVVVRPTSRSYECWFKDLPRVTR